MRLWNLNSLGIEAGKYHSGVLFVYRNCGTVLCQTILFNRTHGITRNNRKEWYAIDRVSKITKANAIISGQSAGQISPMKEPCKFGFSESPKKPSSCEVRTHIL